MWVPPVICLSRCCQSFRVPDFQFASSPSIKRKEMAGGIPFPLSIPVIFSYRFEIFVCKLLSEDNAHPLHSILWSFHRFFNFPFHLWFFIIFLADLSTFVAIYWWGTETSDWFDLYLTALELFDFRFSLWIWPLRVLHFPFHLLSLPCLLCRFESFYSKLLP
jgi:hypothetical protein